MRQEKGNKSGAWVRILALSLAAALGLAACGGNKESSGTAENNAQVAAASKENVFSYKEIELPGFENGLYSAYVAKEGDGFVLVSPHVDYSSLENVEQPAAQDATVEEAPAGMPETVIQVVRGDKDGANLEAKDIPLELGDGQQEFWVQNVYPAQGGGFVLLASVNQTEGEGEDAVFSQSYRLVRLDESGAVQSDMPLDSLFSSEYPSIIHFFPVKGGWGMVLDQEGKGRLVILDQEGNEKAASDLEGNAHYQLEKFLPVGDEAYFFGTKADSAGQVLTRVDAEQAKLEEVKVISTGYSSWYSSLAMEEGLLYLLDYSKGEIAQYSMESGELSAYMNFVNSDFPYGSMEKLVSFGQDAFLGFFADDATGKSKAAFFERVNPEDIVDKQVMVIGCMYMDTEVRRRVVDFNRSSDKYRITIKDYSQYNTEEDYNAGYTRLNTDILSGNMPDILSVDFGTDVSSYESKGLLADIGKLMEEDGEVKKEDLLENIINANSKDGKIYQAIPSFSVLTIAGKTSNLGGRKSWTIEEFLQFNASLPEGVKTFGDLTQDHFFEVLLMFAGADYIDLDTGKCHFDSPEFIQTLEFAKSLPATIDYSEYEYGGMEDYTTQFRENKTMLVNMYLGDLREYNRQYNQYFAEPATMIGFPSKNGQGSVLLGINAYAISAKSPNQEGAWDFIKQFYSKEYQEKLSWGIPVLKEAFLAKVQELTKKPYYIDSDGKKVEYEDSYYVNDTEVIIPPMTQQEADELAAFIQGIENRGYANENITNILKEETAPFFEGQKTAQEVAGIIQSRVQIYVDENR